MSKKLMRKKLALMLANLKKKRKYYCEVEYLQSTGTQWIDTGIVGSSTLKIEMYGQKAGASLGVYFGAGTGNNRIQAVYVSGYNSARIGDITVAQLGADTEKFNIVVDALNKNVIYNGTSYPFAYTSALTNPNIFIFTRNEGTALADKATARCWSFKIWDNGVLVRDLIPVLDWNYTPCMYDKISGRLFYNQGTGTFTYGREIHQVEYLETDGTSYINTGYTPSGSTETEITTMLKNQNTSRFMFGCRTANGQDIYACLSHTSNRIGYRVGTGGYLYSSGYNELNEKHTYKISNGVFYRDGVVVNATCEGVETSPNSPLALLTVNTNNILGYAQTFVGNFYSCTVKDNNVLVRDYIPAIDENGVGFMFDRVTHTIYDNAGSGAFAYPLVELEYLESSGTEYIDMGVGVKSNTVFKAAFSIASTAAERSYFGARNSSNERFQIVNSIGIGAGYYQASSVYPIANQKYEIEMHANGDMYLDGVKRNASVGTFSQVSFERNLWLFATNYYNSSVPPGASTFWKAQVFEGDTIVRDLIPAFYNGQAGMWDKANSVFYANVGTGSFSVGRILEPEYE